MYVELNSLKFSMFLTYKMVLLSVCYINYYKKQTMFNITFTERKSNSFSINFTNENFSRAIRGQQENGTVWFKT